MPPLVPASKSPLLAPSLPLTPLAVTETPLASAPVVSAKPSLDAMIEYMDGDGVMRRSETITNRMVLRGYTVDKAVAVRDDEQAHRSLVSRTVEEKQRLKEVDEELQEAERKREANAKFKRQCKQERRQWIEEGNELVETRLQLWYEKGLGDAPEDEAVDLTKVHTAASPSKRALAFVDEDGNMRRKSVVTFNTPDSAKEDGDAEAVRPAGVTVSLSASSPVC